MAAAQTARYSTPDGQPVWGMMAEFEDVTALYKAAQQVRDAGFNKWDVYAPFPVHGMEEAMGLKPSKVAFAVGTGAFFGVFGAIAMQFWMNGIDYQIANGGKPLIAWEQSTPITFELGVLLSAFGALLGMFALNKLPMWYHPLMKKDRFLRVSDDRFCIAIEATDDQFDPDQTRAFLEELGGQHIDMVEA